MDRRTFLTGGAAVAGLAGVGALAGCRPASEPGTVTYWGQSGDLGKVEDQILAAFAKTEVGRDIKVIKKTVPSNGTGDATSVITAVRGGTAPDVWFMDRYTSAQYAALGLIEPIDGMAEKYGDGVDAIRSQYLGFAADELTYNGKLYGLPTESDTRALYYNRKMIRDAGIDLDELDPEQNPDPITVDRLRELGDQMTEKDGRGNYTKIGNIPWDGQAFWFTWMVQAGATYFDQKSCTIDLLQQPVVDAFQYIYDEARRIGYAKVDAFKATYEPPNHPPAQTSFFSGKQGFQVQTPAFQQAMRKYVPKLDFGITNLPIFKEGDPNRTWSGGFSVVCPKGSSLSRETWEFMKFYAGPEGQAIYMPKGYTLPTSKKVLETTTDPVFTKDLKFHIDLFDVSTSRPPFPVSQLWSDSLSAAWGSITLGSKSVHQALSEAQVRVAPQMELYCPFEMPKGYGTVDG